MLALAWAIVIVFVGLDQLIKQLVILNFAESPGAVREYYTFSIGDFDIFSLTHIRNDGAAWSILGGQTVLLVSFTAVVMAAIAVYITVRWRKLPRLELLCMSLILAGGLGNLIDRVRMLIDDGFTGVVDYIKLEFIDFPVFNLADILVVVGGIGFCVLCVIAEIKASKKKSEEGKKAETGAAGDPSCDDSGLEHGKEDA